MVKKIILGKTESNCLTVEQFVENIIGQFSAILLKEEHISRTDRLKKYRQYENGDEVKAELASMLYDFVEKYERNSYVNEVRFYASKSDGLSNYIELTFNTPFGSKQWLKHMKIRVSDHPKTNDRKVDEYIHLEGKSVEDVEKELDRIVNKRIRRLEREFNMPVAQNENIRRNNNMKLRINESGYSHKKYNLISEDEYNYWYNVGMNAFDNGERCVPAYNKEIVNYMTKHPAKIGSDESKKSNQIAKAWADGWTFRNLYVDNQGLKENTRNRYWVTNDDYIPISSQPNDGYTKLGAIQRAQREAEQDVRLFGMKFGLTMQDAVKDYHIMDSDGNICHDLDNAI